MSHTQDTPNVKNLQGRPCGLVCDGVYHRHISGRKSFMRAWGGGIANSQHELAQAEALGAVTVEVTNTDDGVVYSAPITRIRELGRVINFAPYGSQYLLNFSYWSFTAPLKTGGVSAVKSEIPKPQARQLGLFGEVAHGR